MEIEEYYHKIILRNDDGDKIVLRERNNNKKIDYNYDTSESTDKEQDLIMTTKKIGAVTIDKILDERNFNSETEYLVKYRNFSYLHLNWELKSFIISNRERGIHAISKFEKNSASIHLDQNLGEKVWLKYQTIDRILFETSTWLEINKDSYLIGWNTLDGVGELVAKFLQNKVPDEFIENKMNISSELFDVLKDNVNDLDIIWDNRDNIITPKESSISIISYEPLYYIKWESLDYSQCSWERSADFNQPEKIEIFRKFSKPPESYEGSDFISSPKLQTVTPKEQVEEEYSLNEESLDLGKYNDSLREELLRILTKKKIQFNEITKDLDIDSDLFFNWITNNINTDYECILPIVWSYLKKFSPHYIKKISHQMGDESIDDNKILKIKQEKLSYLMKPKIPFKPYPESPIYKNNNILRSYQLEGVNWMINLFYNRRNGILADEMGLGKTVQVKHKLSQIVAFLDYLNAVHNIRGPFLILVPLSVLNHWKNIFELWTDINVCVYYGGTNGIQIRQMIRDYEFRFGPEYRQDIAKFNVLLTTYEVLLTDANELNNIVYKYVIIDEAHRLKNKNSKLFQVLKQFKYERSLLLTGTPFQNNLNELYNILDFIGIVRNRKEFEEKFSNTNMKQSIEDVQKLMENCLLRRIKEDVEKSIPQLSETIVDVELTDIQKQYYRAIFDRNRSFLYIGCDKATIPNLINIEIELRKCCNHPYLIEGVRENQEKMNSQNLIYSSGKMLLLYKLLPKLKSDGHKVLIFSQMVMMLNLLEEFLKINQYMYERIDGSTKSEDRDSSIKRFCDPEYNRFVFLLSTRAGGLGINLTAADTVIIYDSDWNPQNDCQATARCHRIGQEQQVKVYRLVTKQTYESEMFQRASMKLGLEHALFGQLDDGQSKITKEELENLLRKGAYYILDRGNDKEGETANSFYEADIEDILKMNSREVVIHRGVKGTKFSKATFTTDLNSDLSVKDPFFWNKVLPNSTTPQKLADRLHNTKELFIESSKANFLSDLLSLSYQYNDLRNQNVAIPKHDFNLLCQLLMESSSLTQIFSLKECKRMDETLRKLQLSTFHKRRKSLLELEKDSFISMVCKICERGGNLIKCAGICRKCFHTSCLSEKVILPYTCATCLENKYECTICKEYGAFVKSGQSEMMICSQSFCKRLFHQECLKNHPLTKQHDTDIRHRLFCPLHYCKKCGETSESGFIVQCIRCCSALHEKCANWDENFRIKKRFMVCSEHFTPETFIEYRERYNRVKLEQKEKERIIEEMIRKETKKKRRKRKEEDLNIKGDANYSSSDEGSKKYCLRKRKVVNYDSSEGLEEENICVEDLSVGIKNKYSFNIMEEAKKICCLCQNKNEGNNYSFLDNQSNFIEKDKYIHKKCYKYSTEVIAHGMSYESVLKILSTYQNTFCSYDKCQLPGATLKCMDKICSNYYHIPCALTVSDHSYLKTFHCPIHEELRQQNSICYCKKKVSDDQFASCYKCHTKFHLKCLGISKREYENYSHYFCNNCLSLKKCNKCHNTLSNTFIYCQFCSQKFCYSCVPSTYNPKSYLCSICRKFRKKFFKYPKCFRCYHSGISNFQCRQTYLHTSISWERCLQSRICIVCGQDEKVGKLLQCKECQCIVHKLCYGIEEIENEFKCLYCESNKCPVQCKICCQSTKGIFKSTSSNGWAHMTCALWIDDCTFRNTTTLDIIEGIESIDKSYYHHHCSECGDHNGACISCKEKGCINWFHPACGRTAGLAMNMEDNEGCYIMNAYCAFHSVQKYKTEYGMGCIICKQNTESHKILLCDRCEQEYHYYCITPPLKEPPEGDWFCPECINLVKVIKPKVSRRHQVSANLNPNEFSL